MKNLFLISLLFFSFTLPAFAQLSASQQEALSYVDAANYALSDGMYSDALTAINKAQRILGSNTALFSATRIKIYFGQKNYHTADKEFKTFYSFKVADKLRREMASYRLKIDKEFEKVKVAEAARARRAQKDKENKEKAKRLRTQQKAKADNYSLGKIYQYGGTGKDTVRGFHLLTGGTLALEINNGSSNYATPGNMAFLIKPENLLKPKGTSLKSVSMPKAEYSNEPKSTHIGGNRYVIKKKFRTVGEYYRHPSGDFDGKFSRNYSIRYGVGLFEINEVNSTSRTLQTNVYKAPKSKNNISNSVKIAASNDGHIFQFSRVSEPKIDSYSGSLRGKRNERYHVVKYDSRGNEVFAKNFDNKLKLPYKMYAGLNGGLVFEYTDTRTGIADKTVFFDRNMKFQYKLSDQKKERLSLKDIKIINGMYYFLYKNQKGYLQWMTRSSTLKKIQSRKQTSLIKTKSLYAEAKFVSNPNRRDIYIQTDNIIIKLGSDLHEEWAKEISDTNRKVVDAVLTNKGQLFLAGNSSDGNGDIWFSRLASNGEIAK